MDEKSEKTEKSRKITLKERLGYQFDNMMSKGTIALVGLLFAITLIVVVVAGILVVLLDGQTDSSMANSIWVSLMHAVDAGTLAGDSGSLLFMILMTVVTICGLFITSVLIGIINTGMENKMESLRKGKSCVLEQDHVVILGFNRNIYTLLNEQIGANANQKKGIVVVMDDTMEKEEMEDAIRQRFPDTLTTKIICRSGNISDLSDLHVCAPEYAKSIIVNSQDDFSTIKSILAVTSLLKKADNQSTYITAVLQNRENYEAAMIAGEGRAEILFFEDTIARIVAHTCRQPGYSAIYTELFAFDGDEIYLEEIPQTVGLTMGEVNRYFPKSTVLGMQKQSAVMLNPPADTRIEKGDRLVLIAEDDGCSIPHMEPAPVEESLIVQATGNAPEKKQRMLILGYGPRLGSVLEVEDRYMTPGSQILLAVQKEYEEFTRAMIAPQYQNITVQLQTGDIYHKSELTKLLKWQPESVLVCNSLQEDAEQDDSKTLLLLLQLRATAHAMNLKCSVTSEMRQVENQELAQITEVRDFVISSDITSLMVSQISQTRELNGIFEELLSEHGSEIYMRPAGDYVQLGQPVSLYTAGAAAARKQQVFIGYRRMDADGASFDIYTNPDKSTVVTFDEHDSFVVLAQA